MYQNIIVICIITAAGIITLVRTINLFRTKKDQNNDRLCSAECNTCFLEKVPGDIDKTNRQIQ